MSVIHLIYRCCRPSYLIVACFRNILISPGQKKKEKKFDRHAENDITSIGVKITTSLKLSTHFFI